MNRFLRFTILAFGVVTLSFLAAGVALAATVATTGGLAYVHVHPADGPNLRIPIPVGLLRAGLGAVDHFVGAELDEARRQLAPWQSSLEAIGDELERSAPFVLAEIHGDDADVRIAKTRRRLEVDVEASDATVHVSIPIRLARDLIAFSG